MRRRKLGVRVRLLLAVVAAVAVALAIGVVGGERPARPATVGERDRSRARPGRDRASSLRVENGRVSAPPRRPTAPWRARSGCSREADARGPAHRGRGGRGGPSLRSSAERTLDVRERVRLYALPIVEDGARYGTVSRRVLDPYEETGARRSSARCCSRLRCSARSPPRRGGCWGARCSRSRG